MSDDELLSDEELSAAEHEADAILAEDPQRYEYRDPEYRGGPRNADPDDLVAAAIELTTARVMIEEFKDRLDEAKVQLVERCAEMLDAGIPVEFVAEHSGLRHRASVYRVVQQLPERRRRREAAQKLRAQL